MTGEFSKAIGVCVAVLFAMGLSTAQAQNCSPLVKIASVKLERLANSRRVTVPVTINGVPRKFLLDTAGIVGFVTKETADELKLPGAKFSGGVRPIKTFGLGGMNYELANTENTDSTLVSSLRPVGAQRDGDIDGTLINAFLMNKGDLDLDFPGGTLSLFSPDHCPGQVNHWGAPDVGHLPLSYDTIAIGNHRLNFGQVILSKNIHMKADLGHLTVPVTLDGVMLKGWIDTAAEKSSISLEVAERLFKLKQEELGPTSDVKILPEAALGFLTPGGIPIPAVPAHRRKFSQLSIGHVDIKNLELLIVRDKNGRNNDTARNILYTPYFYVQSVWSHDVAGMARDWNRDAPFSTAEKDVPDMVLGMDVLRHLHIYLSLKENRMYFSAGAAPAQVPAAAPAAR